MSDEGSDTVVIPLGENVDADPAIRKSIVVIPKTKASQDGGEEEESSDDDEATDAEFEEIIEGMESEAKKLYLGKENPVEGEEHEWVDRMPMAMSMRASAITAKERERSKYVLLVRMELRSRPRFSKDSPVQIHSLVIQSPLLRAFLLRVFKDHPSMNTAEHKLVFSKPLIAFVHRWDALTQAAEEEDDPDTKQHVKLLLDAIKEPGLDGTIATRDLCIERDAITFDQLWMIFEPGAIVISNKDRTDCAFKIVKPEIRKNKQGCWFVLDCVCTDWDGEIFGTADVQLLIPRFSGSAKISELNAIPLILHSRKGALTSMLMERARRFQDLADVRYVQYRGTGIDRSDPCDPKKIHVDGRIVIDSDGYIRFNPGEMLTVRSFDTSKTSMEEPDIWAKRYRSGRNFVQTEIKTASEKQELNDEQKLTCRHLVRGFSLKLKRWLDFEIDGVAPIMWNDIAFDRLILSGDTKTLLLALAKGQRDSGEEFDDIIEGKGQGMIIQLNGPPGVGKTLTAEAVAETMRVPLYTISAGDLGIHPDVVQGALSEAFQLARNWSAVLLLDEADVFMEKRSTNDLQRNQLVSLFLQSLEYYQGTLFLTTNRAAAFDEAFDSRVHISIDYTELSPSSRKEVWKTFLLPQFRAASISPPAASSTSRNNQSESNREKLFAITDAEIDDFVSINLNGRQIKNVVKSASLLALSERGPLRAEHVRTVLRIKRAERATE